jgi:dephospho-CoA kinase
MTPRPQTDGLRSQGPWKNGSLPVVGLVGGIGSGKSEVAAMLSGQGAFVIDADKVGHDVLKEPPIRDRIVARFGRGVLARGNSGAEAIPEIDRRALGAIVFGDAGALRALEEVVHPRMRELFVGEIERASREGRWRRIVLDAAILLEAGWADLCDLVVFVDAPRRERMRRVAADRGWPEAVVQSREQAQWSCEEKRRRADVVLVNDKGIEHLRQEVLWLTLLLENWPPPGLERPLSRLGLRVSGRCHPGDDGITVAAARLATRTRSL